MPENLIDTDHKALCGARALSRGYVNGAPRPCRCPGKWENISSISNSALQDALQVSMKEQLVRALGKTLSKTW